MRPGFLVPGNKFSFIQKHEISGSRNAFGSSRACKGGMWDRPSPALCFFFGRKAIHTFWRGSLHTMVPWQPGTSVPRCTWSPPAPAAGSSQSLPLGKGELKAVPSWVPSRTLAYLCRRQNRPLLCSVWVHCGMRL